MGGAGAGPTQNPTEVFGGVDGGTATRPPLLPPGACGYACGPPQREAAQDTYPFGGSATSAAASKSPIEMLHVSFS